MSLKIRFHAFVCGREFHRRVNPRLLCRSRVEVTCESQLSRLIESNVLKRGLTLSGDAVVGLSKNAPDFRLGANLTARAF